MTDYITFDAVIEPLDWGGTIYTIVRLPPEVLAALGPTRRVEGEFADHPVNLAIARAPVDVIDGAFLWSGKSLLDRTGLRPGEGFEARLRPASDDMVEVPRDVVTALRSGGALAAWERLTPGKRRGHLHRIETAKRAETRAARIAGLVRDLIG
ncbi:YdeI/OmpD-associated family protein [Roseicyclus mahoneyensis]|uniref:Bacteriocin resistance YdeI/OmpD-like protein n=1 Tax=Roseicyclus mahoneyensis TaxID=164332 RepID=A0A316GIW3_9RHOB|nr:YdeI/OmpD-associated family protein [Roseicyclus mahoneyensis]PWK60163.1 bacteriocin resistance YdeI/OmpD-like protein [Roseicyclus mahoneyensis]